jgi:triosephosphate isomerase
MGRKYLVAANWKMNGSLQQVQSLLQDLNPRLKDLDSKIDCIICPPSTYLEQAFSVIKKTNMQNIMQLGGQNVASSLVSAFTGEISPLMLREFGCNYVIIGHSERRQLLGETDELVAAKFQVAVEGSMQPILCVGETQQEMETGQGFAVVERQLQVVIQRVGIEAFRDAVIAYEPVWAIGTGLTATPEQAQAMHAKIRAKLASLDAKIATGLRIIYGGSVNSSNAAALFKELDIDGGLIGGASLKAQDFSDICHAAVSMAE